MVGLVSGFSVESRTQTQIHDRICHVMSITFVFYDITTKPLASVVSRLLEFCLPYH